MHWSSRSSVISSKQIREMGYIEYPGMIRMLHKMQQEFNNTVTFEKSIKNVVILFSGRYLHKLQVDKVIVQDILKIVVNQLWGHPFTCIGFFSFTQLK